MNKLVKFIGGPYHGKVKEIEGNCRHLVVQKPPKLYWSGTIGIPEKPSGFCTVNYKRSRVTYHVVYFRGESLRYKGLEVYATEEMINNSKLLKRWSERAENDPNHILDHFRRFRV